MKNKNKTAGKTAKKYKVSLTRYPEEFEVEDTSEAEAIEQAKKKVNWSVWESEAELQNEEEENWTEDPKTEFQCQKCGHEWKLEDGEI